MPRIVAAALVTAALLTVTGTAGAATGQPPTGTSHAVADDGFGWGDRPHKGVTGDGFGWGGQPREGVTGDGFGWVGPRDNRVPPRHL